MKNRTDRKVKINEIDRMKTDAEAKILAILGSIFGFFGFVGAFGWCCSPLAATFFTLSGLSSMLLMHYNLIFLVIGLIFFCVGIFLYFENRKKGQKCEIRLKMK